MKPSGALRQIAQARGLVLPRIKDIAHCTAAGKTTDGDVVVCRYDGSSTIILRNAALDTILHPRIRTKLKTFQTDPQ